MPSHGKYYPNITYYNVHRTKRCNIVEWMISVLTGMFYMVEKT